MPGQADIHELLTHADWLRGLARHLLHEDDAVADVVQQTWTAAVQSPPDEDRPARPWLAQVLRNFVRKNARSARNRGLREAAVAPDEATELSPESLLEAMELQRLLGELVIALEEPYRSLPRDRIVHPAGARPGNVRGPQGRPRDGGVSLLVHLQAVKTRGADRQRGSAAHAGFPAMID